MKIIFSQAANYDLEYFAKKDKRVLIRIRDLLRNIENSPYQGIGKPEPLRYKLSGYWSRRINKKHRLVYKVENNSIKIMHKTN